MKQSEFIQQLKNRGLASSNLFLVYFAIPPGFFNDNSSSMSSTFTLQDFGGDQNAITRYMALYCEEAQIPGIQILTGDNRLQSFVTKMPYQKEWTDLTLTFKCDQDMFQKKFFDRWTEKIVKTSNGDLGYKNDYQTTVVITQFKKSLTGFRTANSVETDLTGELIPVYVTSLVNAFPISVGDVQYSHSAKDDFVKVNITFTFDKLFNEEITGATYITPEPEQVVAEGQDTIYNEYYPDGTDVTPDTRIPIVGDAQKNVFSEVAGPLGTQRFPKLSKYTLYAGVGEPMQIAEALIRENMAKMHLPTQQIEGIGRQIGQYF